MEVILELFGTIILEIIDACCNKKPRLRVRLMTGFFILLAVGFSIFLIWNTVVLFGTGKIIGGTVLGILAFVVTISSIVFIVYMHKKNGRGIKD